MADDPKADELTADDLKPATPSARIGGFFSRLLGLGTPETDVPRSEPLRKPAVDAPVSDLPMGMPAEPALPLEALDPELSPESFESVPTPLPLRRPETGPASDEKDRESSAGPAAFATSAPGRPSLPDPGIGAAILAPTAPSASAPEPAIQAAGKGSWWGRLREGLASSSSAIGGGITDLFTKRRLDDATLEDLEDILIQADLGVDVSGRIVEAVRTGRYERGIEPEAVRAILAREVETVLAPVARPLAIDQGQKPFVILMVGVNGSGKTTTIGKLAQKFTAEGLKVMLAAGDTFRAAAIEQLRVWGQRTGAPVIAREQGSDAASLAFEAVEAAKAAGSDVLLVDTAGRLQNKAQLMDELAKVVRVIAKVEPGAPHAVLLVLDATVGQNALTQTELFGHTAGVTGLVMTKLDGTARGGILVAIADRFGLPVHYIGVGERVEDLEPFSARDFARAIAGFETDAP